MNIILPPVNARVRKSTGNTLYRASYPRPAGKIDISANLQSWTGRQSANGHMPVTHADEHGIEVRLPKVSHGIYRLEIRDGERVIRQQLLLQ